MYKDKLLNYKKNIGPLNLLILFVFTYLLIYFEIRFFESIDLSNLKDDFRRFNRYPDLSFFWIVNIIFPLLYLFNNKLFYEYKEKKLTDGLLIFRLLLSKVFITSSILYFVRVYSISRPKIILVYVIYPLIIFLLFKFLLNKKLFLALYSLVLFSFAYVTIDLQVLKEYKFDECINHFSTKNRFGTRASENKVIYVIGHAYGSHNTDEKGLSKNVISMFSKDNRTKNSTLVLTGDIVLENTKESLILAKKQIEENFKSYLIAPGNHDVRGNGNYFEIFVDDLFIKEEEDFILITGNYSNSDWDLKNNDKSRINSLLKESDTSTVFLFSHQLFWLDYVDNEISPNGFNLLDGGLKKNSLDWINLNGKKLIVISGDYGGMGQDSYCKIKDNKIFIANGIGDLETDTYIEIIYNDEGFRLRKINLIQN